MDTRFITEEDIPACAEIFDASYDNLHREQGTYEEGPAASTWLPRILQHFLRTDPSGGMIATRDGTPIAFVSSIRRDRLWYLSFLFVLPDAQGSGVGRLLLEEVLPEQIGPDTILATVVESFQPVSTGLYASVGMTPRAIKYWLSGATRLDALPEPTADIQRAEMTRADLTELGELDRAVLGFTRTADHEWWASTDMARWVYRHGTDLVAYAYVDDGYIGPALATDEATLCAVVADIMRTAEDPAGVTANIYGDSDAVFQMLVNAGCRIDEAAYRFVYASNTGPPPPSSISNSDWLP